MARSKSSKRWLKEHFDDRYVLEAQRRGLRSRAAFKLEEIQKKDRIIKPGMTVVDLGAAPGGWSELAEKWVGRNGKVIALDILPMAPIAGVEIIEGDFTEQAVLNRLLQALEGKTVDVVLSDIAPNMSGNKSIDGPRAMYLLELVVDFATQMLTPGGMLITKVFQGAGVEQLLKQLRQDFSKVTIRKPEASRARSREVYWIAKR